MNAGEKVTPQQSLQVDVESLYERCALVANDDDAEQCLSEIGKVLEEIVDSRSRGQLFMCRAKVHANRWRTRKAFQDVMAASDLFEEARDEQLATDAESLAAAYASRLGEYALASELAAKSILALESITDEHLIVEVTNRLGIFCYSCLDYDRAIEQFEVSLDVAERLGDDAKIFRARYNITDALLLSVRQLPIMETYERTKRVQHAERLVQQLTSAGMPEMNRQLGSHRLRAEVLCEMGHPKEALEVLERHRTEGGEVLASAQRAALATVEARAMRLTGRAKNAVSVATRAVELAMGSDDEHEIMLTLQERANCKEAAGDLAGALCDERAVNARMRSIQHRQTRQVVQQLWSRTDLEREHKRLTKTTENAIREAEEDVVTGIGNRRRLERVLATSPIDPLIDIAIVIADIDHFKKVNDAFGHGVGDVVLRRLGKLFRDELRSVQEVVRYGGDEFVFVMPGMAFDAARIFAERLRSNIERRPWGKEAPGLKVTVSFGVACGPLADWQTVLVSADIALYAAKRRGRNAVEGAQSHTPIAIGPKTTNKL